MGVVWHDPTVIQNEVWTGTAVIAASLSFSLFALYSTLIRRWLRGYLKFVVVIGGWLVLFAVQLAYIASRGTIVYGVFYDEVTGEVSYAVAENPMVLPVAFTAVATAVVSVMSALISHLYEVYARAWKRAFGVH